MKIVQASSAYAKLRESVKAVIAQGQLTIDQVRVAAYWRIGSLINAHLKQRGGRARYGDQVIHRLGRDVGLSTDLLNRCSQFALKFPTIPIDAARRQLFVTPYAAKKMKNRITLSWSHYRALLPVENSSERASLARRALEESWDASTLESVIRNRAPKKSQARNQKSPARPAPLKPRIGTLGICQIQDSRKRGWPGASRLLLDQGFRIYRQLNHKPSAGLTAGALVRLEQDRLRPFEGSETNRFFYRALIEKVIDGDTFWAAIDLGFSEIARQKLRLRGIDAPELSEPGGRKARRFVQSVFLNNPEVLIQSSSSATFDRFEADVFFSRLPDLKNQGARPSPLRIGDGSYYFLNQILMDHGLARRVTR